MGTGQVVFLAEEGVVKAERRELAGSMGALAAMVLLAAVAAVRLLATLEYPEQEALLLQREVLELYLRPVVVVVVLLHVLVKMGAVAVAASVFWDRVA